MKEFNYEAAKNGAPVQTRDGRKARIICFDFKQEHMQPIVALVEEEDGYEHMRYHCKNGHYLITAEECDDDLVMVPTKHEGWMNVYKDTFLFESREKAEAYGKVFTSYRATVKIEWEE